MLLIRNEPLSKYTGYENYEEVNGPLTLSLTSFSVGNLGHTLLEEEAVIEAFDGREYRIKQMKENKVSKSIEAVSTFFDLGGHQKDSIYGGTRTFKQFADWLFAGTGWTWEADPDLNVEESRLIPNYGNDNFLKLHEVLLATFECERQILPGKRVRFARKLGPNRDAQYRYGHNIKALSRSVDTTSLYTSIKGYGGNGLVVTYTSPNASKFPHAGEQDPIRDERFTVASSFTERLRQELNDTPKVAIELDALELVEKELGERVWLIYEPLNIEFQTRILAKTTRIPAEKSSAIIGNAMPKKMTDALTDTNVKIDENDKQNQSKFEQTNERFAFEVERLDGDIVEARASWTVEADGIRGEVIANRTYTDEKLGEVREEASTNFDILAGQVTAAVQTTRNYTDSEVGKVQTTATSNFNILSGRINSKAENSVVTALGTRTTTVEQDLNAVEGTLTQKVSYTDYTGANIINKIELAPAGALISATKIELEGIVRVADRVEFGRANNGQLKGLSFNGGRATVYSQGDSVTLSASYIIAEGLLEARHPTFGNGMPAITGTSLNQRLALGIDGNFLNVFDGNGTRRRLQFV